MSRLRRRVREDLLNPEEPMRWQADFQHDSALALALLPALQIVHANLRWVLESVCWLDLAVRTGTAMTRVGAMQPPPAPAARADCVVIDFPRAASKQKPR